MGILGCNTIGIKDPTGADRKKLLVWVEIDRCMTDALSVVTGAKLGRRSLKFVDYGKVAASFLNLDTSNAIRISARDSSRALADTRYPEIASKKERQMRTYFDATDTELFSVERVSIEVSEQDLPGRPRSRVSCSKCGEGINDRREVLRTDGSVECRSCAVGGYYTISKVDEPELSGTPDLSTP